MSALMKINFHGHPLYAADRDGEIYVAVKPIVETLGLAWNKQLERIKRDTVLAEGMTIMVLPSAGGEQETTLLRHDLVNGFLFTIDANRVAPAAREKVLTYQRECYRVLHEHFFVKAERAVRAQKAMTQAEAAGRTAMHHLVVTLTAKLHGPMHPVDRAITYQLLEKSCAELGIAVPAVEQFSTELPPPPSPEVDFWEGLEDLFVSGVEVNHTDEPGLLALHMRQLRPLFAALRPALDLGEELEKILLHSDRFIEKRAVNSIQQDRTLNCWVFRAA